MHVKHDNSAFPCLGCEEVLNRYAGLYPELRDWFYRFRSFHPEAHCCQAGRNKAEQEEAFYRGASLKEWPDSGHNCNCAIDLFPLINGKAEWSHEWYNRTIPPMLYGGLRWLGAPGIAHGLQDMDHVEVRNWQDLLAQKKVTLIE